MPELCVNCRLFEILSDFRKAGFIVLLNVSKADKTSGDGGYPWSPGKARIWFDIFAPIP